MLRTRLIPVLLSGNGNRVDPLAPPAVGGIDLQAADDDGVSSTDNTTSITTNLSYDISGLTAVALNGDVLELEIFGAGITVDDTLDAGEISGDTVTLTVAGPVPIGTYTARARLNRGGHLGAWTSIPLTIVGSSTPANARIQSTGNYRIQSTGNYRKAS